jgi:C1A family cysteine protease
MKQHAKRAVGKHAAMVAGYNDAEKRLIVRHSRGTKWGTWGYFTMLYAYFADRD